MPHARTSTGGLSSSISGLAPYRFRQSTPAKLTTLQQMPAEPKALVVFLATWCSPLVYLVAIEKSTSIGKRCTRSTMLYIFGSPTGRMDMLLFTVITPLSSGQSSNDPFVAPSWPPCGPPSSSRPCSTLTLSPSGSQLMRILLLMLYLGMTLNVWLIMGMLYRLRNYTALIPLFQHRHYAGGCWPPVEWHCSLHSPILLLRCQPLRNVFPPLPIPPIIPGPHQITYPLDCQPLPHGLAVHN